MFLFELAMELDERSADMAEAATSLGFEGVTPTTELTPEQVQAFRARFTKAAVLRGPGGPSDDGAYHPPTWGPPEGSAGPLPPAPSERSMGVGQMVVIALVVVGVIGLFAFMFKNGGTDQERLDRIVSAEPKLASEVAGPEDIKNLAEFCGSMEWMYGFSQDQSSRLQSDDIEGTKDLVEAGYERWKQHVAVVKKTVPDSFAPSMAAYEQNRRQLFDAWTASPSMDETAQRVSSIDPGPGAQPWHDLQTMYFEEC